MTNQSQVANASIVKIDDDKRLVFGWASIIKDESGKILLDRQDDFIDSEDELEKAAYDYVLHSRDGGEMHVRRGVSKMVESVVFTEEKQRALGIPVGSMPTGWWIGFRVEDDRVWEQVKKGDYAGFSVHGTGRRESTELPVSKITEVGKADTKKKKNKIATVMGEFKAGKLKSSSGEKVTDPKQAMAIAISEQKRAKMKKVSVSEIVAKTAELMKVGDKPGHPFRGNQYTSPFTAERNALSPKQRKTYDMTYKDRMSENKSLGYSDSAAKRSAHNRAMEQVKAIHGRKPTKAQAASQRRSESAKAGAKTRRRNRSTAEAWRRGNGSGLGSAGNPD